MKQLLFIAVSFVLASALKAQDTMSNKVMHNKIHHEMKDCVMIKDDKMFQM